MMTLLLNQNSKEEALAYLQEQFKLDYTLNLDGLYDLLCTLNIEIRLEIDNRPCLQGILLVFKQASIMNPCLRIQYQKEW
ncbi:hypothetical protein [Floccifex sp.]|uniref:hypothetical protein n=1 Tax=Floccifex sp. TaxID=2815810 RepID=UPI003F093FCB